MDNSCLKFRAWDEENEEMLYSGRDYEQCTFVCEGAECGGKLKCYVPERVPSSNEEPEHIIGRELTTIMQYTGLKDKNGKEAYHHDIIEAWVSAPWNKEEPTRITGEIVWDNDGWWFRCNECNMYDDYLCNHTFEVIGNIHENKELLK